MRDFSRPSWKIIYCISLPIFLLILYLTRPAVGFEMNLEHMLAMPSAEHWLGTDNMGRDLQTRLWQAFSWTIVPMWILVVICNVIAVALFLFIEKLSMVITGLSLVSFQFASWITLLPVTLAVFATSVFWQKTGGFSIYAPLALILVMRFMVVLKLLLAESMRLQYWQAHNSLGGGLLHRIVKYGIVYGWRNTLISQTVADMRMVVIVEASLSYLGFGVAEPIPSIGNILSAHFNDYLHGGSFVTSVVIVFMCLVLLMPMMLLEPLTLNEGNKIS